MTKSKHETTRILRVTFTDAQRLELGRNLAEEHNLLTQINSDLDRIKSEYKSKVSACDAKIVDLANKVSTGYEMREVKCLWVTDCPVGGKKRLFRVDDPGKTTLHVLANPALMDASIIVETVDMTEADKQMDLPTEKQGDLLNPVLPAKTGVAGDGTITVPADGKTGFEA